MKVGRAVGYSPLALIDATVAAVTAVVIAGFNFVFMASVVERAITLALGVGAATFVLTLLASTVSHYRGGSRSRSRGCRNSPWVVWRRRQRRR